MHNLLNTPFTLLLLFFATPHPSTQRTLNVKSGDSKFCYTDPSCGPSSDKWPGICQTGKNQSPVNIKYTRDDLARARQNPRQLQFNGGYSGKEFYIQNVGHSIQVSFSPDLTSKSTLNGSGFEFPYIFAQAHFHWGNDAYRLGGSEHTINGNRLPMELHLVHYNSKYSSVSEAVASGDPNGLAVVGVFLDPVDQPESRDNPAFRTIAHNLPMNYEHDPQKIAEPINLKFLLPQRGQPFFRYNGSLTTPSCQEIVLWTVVPTPFLISMQNYKKFHSVRNEDGVLLGENYRPVKALGQRKIEIYTKM